MSADRGRGSKITLKSGGVAVAVSLHRTEIRDLIPKRDIEKRTSEGHMLTQKQYFYDAEGNQLDDVKLRREWTDDLGNIYDNEDALDVEKGAEARPYSKTDIVELARLEKSSVEDYLYTDYYEALPESERDARRLWELAKDIRDNGPLYGPIVFRRGFKREIAILTSEIDEDKGIFAILVRLTNSRIRLSQPRDIPQEIKGNLPNL